MKRKIRERKKERGRKGEWEGERKVGREGGRKGKFQQQRVQFQKLTKDPVELPAL